MIKAQPKRTKTKKLELEAKAWLAEKGFSAEEVTELLVKFTPARMAQIADDSMRQSDYDRQLDADKVEMETARAELKTANDRINAEMAEWGRLANEGKAATTKMQADLEAAQVAETQLRQRVTKLATDAGLDPAEVLKDLGGAPKPEVTAPDMTGYVRTDDLAAAVAKQLGRIPEAILDVPAELFMLGHEHQALFGETLDLQALNAEIKARVATPNNTKSLNPRAVWEELHDVGDKRTAVATAKHDTEISDAVERGRQEVRSEAAIPGSTTTPGRHAAVFVPDRKSAIERPQPLTTVTSAAAALRSGKYRGSGTGAGDGAAAT